jgi:hypothetical protein
MKSLIIFIIPIITASILGMNHDQTIENPTPKLITPVVQTTLQPTQPIQPETLNDLINKYFPENARAKALKIANCESSGNEQAIGHNKNGSTDNGYFQINSIHKARVKGDLSKLLNGQINVRIASELYNEQGFDPWYSSKHCWQ